MTGDSPPIAPNVEPVPIVAEPVAAPRRARWPLWLAVACLVVGGIVTAVLLPKVQNWWSPMPTVQPAGQGVLAATRPVTPAAAAMPITLEGLAAREVALDAQLRALEARMAATDAASRTAANNAVRAERILIVTAARRELNRGLPLAHLENQLRIDFADRPAEVATVIAAGRAPVTLEDLRHALNTLGPTLVSGSTRQGVWSAIKRELSSLIVVRRESSPSPLAYDRLDRARRMIDSGNVEGALAEVARTPGAADATSWMDAAKRWIEARRALNVLEVSAMRGAGPPMAPVPAAESPLAAPVPAADTPAPAP